MTEFNAAPHLKTIKAAIARNQFGPAAMKARAALLANGWNDDSIFDAIATKTKKPAKA